MSAWRETARVVEATAGGRCEYYLIQILQGATFHVEHIVPSSRGGASELDNLAWCCPSCNLSKSDRIEAADPEEGNVFALFNPRTDSWKDHFRWDGYILVAKTPSGTSDRHSAQT